MSIKHTLTKSWAGPAGQISKANAFTGVQEANLDFVLAASTTNQQMNLAFKVSLLQSIFIQSDQAITMKTNSTTTPGDTKNIAANDPLIASGTSSPFAVDVTTVYFSNAGATAANVQVRCLTNG